MRASATAVAWRGIISAGLLLFGLAVTSCSSLRRTFDPGMYQGDDVSDHPQWAYQGDGVLVTNQLEWLQPSGKEAARLLGVYGVLCLSAAGGPAGDVPVGYRLAEELERGQWQALLRMEPVPSDAPAFGLLLASAAGPVSASRWPNALSDWAGGGTGWECGIGTLEFAANDSDPAIRGSLNAAHFTLDEMTLSDDGSGGGDGYMGVMIDPAPYASSEAAPGDFVTGGGYPIPEPSVWALLVCGVAVQMAARRCRGARISRAC